MPRGIIVIIGFVVITLGITTMFLVGDRPEQTTEYLQSIGYQNIRTTGYSFFGCMRDPDALTRTGFYATDEKGNQVEGTYCWEPIFGAYLQVNPVIEKMKYGN